MYAVLIKKPALILQSKALKRAVICCYICIQLWKKKIRDHLKTSGI